jgi:hypothetical protein
MIGSHGLDSTEVFAMKRLMLLGALAIGAAGCTQDKPAGDGAKQPAAAPSPGDAAALDAAVLAEKPANAISVRDALTRSDGEKVVVTGRVPGEKLKPYNAAVAAFVMMSPEDLDREDIKSEFDCDDAAT